MGYRFTYRSLPNLRHLDCLIIHDGRYNACCVGINFTRLSTIPAQLVGHWQLATLFIEGNGKYRPHHDRPFHADRRHPALHLSFLGTNRLSEMLDLPNELLSLIPDILGAQYLTQLDNFGPTSVEHRALANAALVCKHWHFKASRYLNGFLKLTSLSDVLAALQDIPKQANIHSLSIWIETKWMSDQASIEQPVKQLLDALPNLHRLEIGGPPSPRSYGPASQFPAGREHIKELLSSGRLSHLTLVSCRVPSEVFTSLAPSIISLAIEDVEVDTIESDRLLLPPQLHALKLENHSHVYNSITAPDLFRPYQEGEDPSWFSTLEILILSGYASAHPWANPTRTRSMERSAVRNLLDAPKLRAIGFARPQEIGFSFLADSLKPETLDSDSEPLEPPLTLDALQRFEAISIAMWKRNATDPFRPLVKLLEAKGKRSSLKELRLDFTPTRFDDPAVILSMRRDIFDADWKALDAILCKEAYGSLQHLVIDVSCEPSRKPSFTGTLVPHEWLRCKALPMLASRGVTITVLGDLIHYGSRPVPSDLPPVAQIARIRKLLNRRQ
ncbi:hypothetical protein BKA70DRAFT_1332933 [Coprinopsis sp. MPI-PUGE-AT-0042]|nr:hypothetical protein BKA70DRAFT_1332933 [Coprinopsis sp. MPI-PUGE-AT-0042]